MEPQELIASVTGLIDSLGMVGLLIWLLISERKHGEKLEDEILKDWNRQHDREADQK